MRLFIGIDGEIKMIYWLSIVNWGRWGFPLFIHLLYKSYISFGIALEWLSIKIPHSSEFSGKVSHRGCWSC
jgi:hypothetical protein